MTWTAAVERFVHCFRNAHLQSIKADNEPNYGPGTAIIEFQWGSKFFNYLLTPCVSLDKYRNGGPGPEAPLGRAYVSADSSLLSHHSIVRSSFLTKRTDEPGVSCMEVQDGSKNSPLPARCRSRSENDGKEQRTFLGSDMIFPFPRGSFLANNENIQEEIKIYNKHNCVLAY